MKKNALTFACAAFVTLMFVGCGKSEKEASVEAPVSHENSTDETMSPKEELAMAGAEVEDDTTL